MKIILKQLRISNFKGIPAMVVNFLHETMIFGANGTGKTSIADAWYWLLFGKNSADEKDFNVKNTVQTELNELDHEVEASLLIDGEETTIRHIYREKHQKKKGAAVKTYTGNEHEYFWNGVPCLLKDWNAKIENILSAETFKKITHPSYFCSTINWQKRRETLIEMAGTISDRDIVGNDKQLNKLLDAMGKKSIKYYRSELSARKKKINENLEHIPARIDEAKQSLPETPDFDALQIQINQAAADLNEIDLQLSNKTAAQKKWQDEQSRIQQEIHSLNRKYADLQNKLRIELQNQDRTATADIDAAEARIATLKASLTQLEKDKVDAEARIKKYNDTREELIAEWRAINARKFEYPEFSYDESENICPHCKQQLPESDINTRKETLSKNHQEARERSLVSFNKNNERELADNKATGIKTATAKKEVEGFLSQIVESINKKWAEINTAEQSLADLKQQYTAPTPLEERLAAVLKNNKEATSIKAALEQQNAMVKEEPVEDNAEAKSRKVELASLLSDLNKRMGLKEIIAATNQRIDKLTADEKEFSQQLADVECEEDILMQFEKIRMEQINFRVNGLFKYVKFKLFDYTIEGGEIPCCETMLNGVPYSDLNTAGRIKSGIDVINALSNHYNVYAPIFLDNRESVTAIPYTESQVINFIVSDDDKKLRIEGTKMMEAV